MVSAVVVPVTVDAVVVAGAGDVVIVGEVTVDVGDIVSNIDVGAVVLELGDNGLHSSAEFSAEPHAVASAATKQHPAYLARTPRTSD